MSFSRRKFLQRGTIALFALGTPVTAALAAHARTPVSKAATGPASPITGPLNSLPRMSKAAFAPYLNTLFFLRRDDGTEIPLKLRELQDSMPKNHPEFGRTGGKECFALVFAASAGSLKQKTYRLRHDGLGEFDLFIGQVRSRKQGELYEAIINHLDK